MLIVKTENLIYHHNHCTYFPCRYQDSFSCSRDIMRILWRLAAYDVKYASRLLYSHFKLKTLKYMHTQKIQWIENS